MRIAELVESESTLEVVWDDGTRSVFLYLWLRDNCTCAECGDTRTGARFLRLTDVPPDTRPTRVEIDEQDRVSVHWSKDAHRSVYAASWLYEHCPLKSRQNRTRPIVWDQRKAESITRIDYAPLINNENACVTVMEELLVFGFVLIDGLPATQEAAAELAALLGPIRAQSYAPVFDIWTRDNHDILSNTEAGISPHVDEPFRTHTPGLFVLHCLTASATGGANVLVDGFMLASVLRQQNPEDFRTLCDVPIPHHRHRDGAFHYYMDAPVFTLDAFGEVSAFRFAERSAAPMQFPVDLMQRVYAARRALLTLAYHPKYQVRIELKAGQALLIDNHRLMHGREAFTGERHLRQCNIDRDEAMSRYRLQLQNMRRGV